MGGRRNHVPVVILLLLGFSAAAPLTSQAGQSTGAPRYYSDDNNSLHVLLTINRSYGPVGAPVTLTAYVFDAGVYFDPEYVNLTMGGGWDWENKGAWAMERVDTGIYTLELVIGDIEGDDISFKVIVTQGDAFDSAWAMYDIIRPVQYYHGPRWDSDIEGSYMVRPGDVVNITHSYTNRTTGEGVGGGEVECTYVSWSGDDLCFGCYPFYDDDGWDVPQEERTPVETVSTGNGTWTSQFTIPPSINETVSYHVLNKYYTVEGGYLISEDRDSHRLEVVVLDVWYMNVSIDNESAEFDIYVYDLDGSPVQGARVTCQAALEEFWTDPTEWDVVELEPQMTDRDGRAGFEVSYGPDVEQVHVRGWARTSRYSQYFTGDMETPFEPGAVPYDDDVPSWNDYISNGNGITLRQYTDGEYDYGDDMALDYTVYREWDHWSDDIPCGTPLTNTTLYYYMTSESYRDHIMATGSVRTDERGNVTLEYTVPPRSEFFYDGDWVRIEFEGMIEEEQEDPFDEGPLWGSVEGGFLLQDYEAGSDWVRSEDIVIESGEGTGGADISIFASFPPDKIGYFTSILVDPAPARLLDSPDVLWDLPAFAEPWTGYRTSDIHPNYVELELDNGTGGAQIRLPHFLSGDWGVVIYAYTLYVEDEDGRGHRHYYNHLTLPIGKGTPVVNLTALGLFQTSWGEPHPGLGLNVSLAGGGWLNTTTDRNGVAVMDPALPPGDHTLEVRLGDETVIGPMAMTIDGNGTVLYNGSAAPPRWDPPSSAGGDGVNCTEMGDCLSEWKEEYGWYYPYPDGTYYPEEPIDPDITVEPCHWSSGYDDPYDGERPPGWDDNATGPVTWGEGSTSVNPRGLICVSGAATGVILGVALLVLMNVRKRDSVEDIRERMRAGKGAGIQKRTVGKASGKAGGAQKASGKTGEARKGSGKTGDGRGRALEGPVKGGEVK